LILTMLLGQQINPKPWKRIAVKGLQRQLENLTGHVDTKMVNTSSSTVNRITPNVKAENLYKS